MAAFEVSQFDTFVSDLINGAVYLLASQFIFIIDCSLITKPMRVALPSIEPTSNSQTRAIPSGRTVFMPVLHDSGLSRKVAVGRGPTQAY